MNHFRKIDEHCIVIINGIYKTVPLATREGLLFIVMLGGCIALYKNKSTSHKSVRWVAVPEPYLHLFDSLGRMKYIDM